MMRRCLLCGDLFPSLDSGERHCTRCGPIDAGFYPVPPVESLKVERQNALYVSAGMNILKFP